MLRRRERKIIFPFFQDCIQYAESKYWKDIFDDFSRGKFPDGMEVCGHNVIVKKRKTEVQVSIDQSPEQIYQKCSDAVKKVLRMFSTDETVKIMRTMAVDQSEKKLKYDKWSNIRREAIKMHYLHKFSMDVATKYSLTSKQTQGLLNLLSSAISIKSVDDRVDFYDGKIQEIHGLEYCKETETFTLEHAETEEKKTVKIVSLKKQWKKYLTNRIKSVDDDEATD